MQSQYLLAPSLTVALALASCAVPLSEELARRKIPVSAGVQPGEAVDLVFSADRKYETGKGVPLEGDPLICVEGKVSRVNDGTSKPNRISVPAGQEVAVTSVVAWVNTGFRQVCGPFVTFAPEKGATYVVVNERIGGKGISALWTGMARQTCEVSVFRESSSGFTRVATRKTESGACRVPEV